MTTYRKKPIEVNALCWAPKGKNKEKRPEWFLKQLQQHNIKEYLHHAKVKTDRGWLHVHIGDWIIQGTKNEVYPCDPKIFAEIYEEIPCPSENEKPGPVTSAEEPKKPLDQTKNPKDGDATPSTNSAPNTTPTSVEPMEMSAPNASEKIQTENPSSNESGEKSPFTDGSKRRGRPPGTKNKPK